MVTEGVVTDITRLDAQHTVTRPHELKHELEEKVSVLKLIEATHAAKDVMYARQHILKYRDKPNKQLARILAESRENQVIPDIMVTKGGAEVGLLKNKFKKI